MQARSVSFGKPTLMGIPVADNESSAGRFALLEIDLMAVSGSYPYLSICPPSISFLFTPGWKLIKSSRFESIIRCILPESPFNFQAKISICVRFASGDLI